MSNKPQISVIMSFYNTEKYIEEAIKSVISQNFTDFELILINDCSNDNSLNIANKYVKLDSRIKLVDSPNNLGPACARNLGIKISCGKYIAIFDADDICMVNRLRIQFDFLEKNKNIFLVGGSFIHIEENGKIIDKTIYKLNFNQLLIKLRSSIPVVNSTVMFRNSGYLYREKLLHAEDYDLWLRMITDGKKLEVLENVLIYCRIHSGSISNQDRRGQKKYIKLVQKLFKERIKTGHDSYSSIEPILMPYSKNINNSEKLVALKKLKMLFKNSSDMVYFRKELFIFIKKYGFFSWKVFIIYYIISFTSEFFRKYFKKIIWG